MAKSQQPSLRGVQQAEWDTDVKQEMVDSFREMAEGLWAHLSKYIGVSSTAAIFQSALHDSGRNFPFLLVVKATNRGLRTQGLRGEVGQLERQTLRLGLLAFTNNLIALLTDLTGDILIQKLEPSISSFQARMNNL